ncbi:putative Squalene synthase [Cardiosporidium cionae]|uniref:Squalene synthase n=1 Tax=Cardiosporidium cionae TaxID=476202 RepID=A0ABQ7J7E0_9APIC|nr:putative Squalene synthase [Cardiosporidium cionae]|eukprot:KAF8819902.1 putative Squalene synthase [Cardiosporidium cionae]
MGKVFEQVICVGISLLFAGLVTKYASFFHISSPALMIGSFFAAYFTMGRSLKWIVTYTHMLLKVVLIKMQRMIITSTSSDCVNFCFTYLQKTSRSFSAVTMLLPSDLRFAVTVFYLVLRALDSIEDDMSIPIATKKQEMLAFASQLEKPACGSNKGFGNGLKFMNKGANIDEVNLLKHFDEVIKGYQSLRSEYQLIISHATLEMAHGMVEFLEKDVETVRDYDRYCFFVAGIVGIGLSQLFTAAKVEKLELPNLEYLAVSMGTFLQKTNIIRDYFEDISQGEPRIFYPKEIWCKYVSNIVDLQKIENSKKGTLCVNEMILDALRHIPDVITYLSALQNSAVFSFCAIPQCMAIATLKLCFHNPAVLNSLVKIPRKV